MTGHEVELDQHTTATRNLSALLSAALAAAQAAAQVSAQRARATAQRADQQTRQAEQITREQNRLTQQQAERQQRATQNVQHRPWSLKPTAQWLHDKPLSAAAAWASADVAREHNPVAARHAEQWEAIFATEGVDLDAVRADAPAAVAVPDQHTPTQVADVEGDLAAAAVAESAVSAGTSDLIEAMRNDPALLAEMENDLSQFHRQGRVWTAYADGAPPAALGGRGVSTPPSQVLAKSRETPDLAATASDSTGRYPRAHQQARGRTVSATLPEFVYSCVEDWVLNLLSPTIERRLDAAGAGTLTWCPQWWLHAEAIARLEALWRAWEVCRDADGEAPSRWFWQHCDPMLAVLMDAKSGPLSNCKPGAHGKYDTARTLPSTPAPAGYWGSEVAAIA